MPELDFMILADRVRAENGVVNILGGGIDQVMASNVPVLHGLGIAARITFTATETAETHAVGVAVRFGSKVLGIAQTGPMPVEYPADVPEGWPAAITIGLNLNVPLQDYGTYHVDMTCDERQLKTVSFLVRALPVPPGLGE
jgi:hypothetical protein